MGDGLYITKENIKQCKKELGCEILIKTGEERLVLIDDAGAGAFKMADRE